MDNSEFTAANNPVMDYLASHQGGGKGGVGGGGGVNNSKALNTTETRISSSLIDH